MSSISICGTSYLIPNSSAWDNLKKNHKVKFLNYNNFDEILLDNTSEYLVCIINFKDIIDFPIIDISNKNLSKIYIKIKKLFNVFQKKLKQNNQKIFLVYDLHYSSQILRLSNLKNFEENVINFLENKIFSLAKYRKFFRYNLTSNESQNLLLDEKFFYLAKCRYSLTGLQILSQVIEKILIRFENPTKKVLALDCDNTLWGGVIGEDGIHKIKLGGDGEGNIYSNFQKSIKRLKNEGVVLVAVTKNDKKIINKLFKENKNMILKKTDFAAIYANWGKKSDNLKEISKNLDLGLSSFIFFDDNPIERDEVKENAAEIEVIEPSEEITNWPQQIFDEFNLNKLTITKEDIKKSYQYSLNLKFKSEKKSIHNEEGFLKGLKLKANRIKINKSNISRVMQIIQKTNQFNLRTIRYTEREIVNHVQNDKNMIFLVNLNDKYGDHGLVGLVILKREKNIIFIDNIAVSCRVLGRYIEHWIMSEIIKIAKNLNVNFLLGEYIKTDRNVIVSDFYEKLKFKIINNNDTRLKSFKKKLKKNSKKYISQIKDIDCKYSAFY